MDSQKGQKALFLSLSNLYGDCFMKEINNDKRGLKTELISYYSSPVAIDSNSVVKEDENRSFTERLKRAVKAGVIVCPLYSDKLQNNEVINFSNIHSYFLDGAILPPTGVQTSLPNIINPMAQIKITKPFFTLGELVEIKDDGSLGYVIGAEIKDYEYDEGYPEWVYDVLSIHDLFYGNCQSEVLLENELSKISSKTRLPLKVKMLQTKIGDYVIDSANVIRVATKINWHCHINISDYIDKVELTSLEPFYTYTFTRWDEFNMALDNSDVEKLVREHEIKND